VNVPVTVTDYPVWIHLIHGDIDTNEDAQALDAVAQAAYPHLISSQGQNDRTTWLIRVEGLTPVIRTILDNQRTRPYWYLTLGSSKGPR
jgi:hypothetical protein